MARRRPFVWYMVSLAVGLGMVLGNVGSLAHAASRPTIRTIIIGGSAASGWNDPVGHGYVERGLNTYGRVEGVHFSITNYGISGAPVVDAYVAREYPTWLRELGPNGLVVLAWGLLNDLRRGTPPKDIAATIHQEIALALTHGDVVLLVTPPVTRLSVGQWRVSEADLVRLEAHVASSFHSSRVHVVNMYFPELHLWLTRHYRPVHYMYNGFDPNLEGYILAGNILAGELEEHWNSGPTIQGASSSTMIVDR